MAEKRQFNRISYVSGGTLTYRNRIYNCRVENLSMSGAFVTIKSKPDFLPGNVCVLEVYDELECRLLTMETVIAHQAADYVGLKFIYHKVDTQISLEMIMERESNVNLDADEIPHLI